MYVCMHTQHAHIHLHRQLPPLQFLYGSAVQFWGKTWLLPPADGRGHLDVSSFTVTKSVSSWKPHPQMNTPTHLYFLICLPQTGNKGTTMDTQNRGSKMRHSHTLCMHTLKTLKTGNHSCPHSNPEGTTHTCKRQTHTTVPPACDLHLGKGIFHLGVTASGQACIPTHTDTCAHTLYLLSLPVFPPATLFHSVDIRGPPPHTHTRTNTSKVQTLLVNQQMQMCAYKALNDKEYL